MARVVIIDNKTGDIVSMIPCKSRYEAEKVESGVNINLDHENFYTSIDED